ncbi:MAG: transglutaminase [Rhizobiales bacterium]|nr:transglutaminase [Hyphomicrobiales bacterium]
MKFQWQMAGACVLWLALSAAFAEGLASEPHGLRNVPAAEAFQRSFGPTTAPFGFVAFCREQPGECIGAAVSHRRFSLDNARWKDLEEVNDVVNRTVWPASDRAVYGIRERWALPRTFGDCEDYVLLKRRLLMDRGWPASALLIAVVIDEAGEGHAVLVARGAEGDFVLDNRNAAILPWSQTVYQFIKRQSYRNPREWVALQPE